MAPTPDYEVQIQTWGMSPRLWLTVHKEKELPAAQRAAEAIDMSPALNLVNNIRIIRNGVVQPKD
jgi:hypothetical protein